MPKVTEILIVTIPVTGHGWSATVVDEPTAHGGSISSTITGYDDAWWGGFAEGRYVPAIWSWLVDMTGLVEKTLMSLTLLPTGRQSVPRGMIAEHVWPGWPQGDTPLRQIAWTDYDYESYQLGRDKQDYAHPLDRALMQRKLGIPVRDLRAALDERGIAYPAQAQEAVR